MRLPINTQQSTAQIILRLLIIAGVLMAAVLLPLRGYNLIFIIAGVVGLGGAVLVLTRPVLGFAALILSALIIPIDISTGTEVSLNASVLLIPALILLWVVNLGRTNEIRLASSPVNRPIFLFLIFNLIALIISNTTWNPAIPRSNSFILVQLAQWAILAFALGLFLLVGNRIQSKQELRRLTLFFLGLGCLLSLVWIIPILNQPLARIFTLGINRPPFWIVLFGLAGGQLLFNTALSSRWRAVCALIIGITLVNAFIVQRDTTSYWLGIFVVAGLLVWFRWPRLRWAIVGAIVALILAGVFIPAVYEFAGGEDEWLESGGSRIALITRVMEVTIENNPITGLGPAGYRPYANATPLAYLHIIWVQPSVSSHNNFVDIFSFGGIIGFGLFVWVLIEIVRPAFRLRQRFQTGFLSGYVNGMIAVGGASLAIMLLADWILPFVYNIGFPGFQSSLFFWLFLGGLIAIEQFSQAELE